VVNHFSIAASNAGNSTTSQSFMEPQKKSIDKTRREKSKTTIDQLPSLKANQLFQSDFHGRNSKIFNERKMTLGAHSD